MKKSSWCAFGLLLSSLLPTQPLPAQLLWQQGRTSRQNFDIRDDGDLRGEEALSRRAYLARRLTPEVWARSAELRARLQTAASGLRAEHRDWHLELNRFGFAPEVLGADRADAFLTGDSTLPREEILRRFLTERAGLFGLTAAQIQGLAAAANYSNPSGNLAWVELTQKMRGIPVFQGEMRAAFTARGALARLTGNLASGLEEDKLAATPVLAPAQAVAAGAAAVGQPAQAEVFRASPGADAGILAAGPFVRTIEPALVWFPLAPGTARLAYTMTLWEKDRAWFVLVDAEDGTLLFRKNITDDQTQPATYSVYNSDSPSPLSPTTALPGSGFQPPLIARSSISLVSELPAYDNLGWIADGGTTTTGNNVDAGLDVVSPDGIDSGGRPVSATRDFTFAYNPAPGNPAGGDAANGTTIRNGVVTHLFFWTNRFHDRLYPLGFTEAAKNFQTANFGRNPGGTTSSAINGNDAVLAQVQDYGGTNNANFSTPADGSAPTMQMYLFNFPTPNRDGSLDADVFLHEMTHGLSNRLHSNGSGLFTTQARGMGEGWSDYYARCLLATADENVAGVYASGGYATYLLSYLTDNYYYGIRRFPYAVLSNTGANGKPHNPLTFADIDPAQEYLADGAYGNSPIIGTAATEVHNMGEIWCMALLEMRARLITRLGFAPGNQRALQIVTDAMKLDPASPTIIQARDAIIAGDNAGFAGADVADIRKSFALRGIGAGASTNGITVVESFSPDLFPGSISSADTYGNGNGVADPGEDILLTVPLSNPLTVSAPGVKVVIGNYTATYGNLAAGASATQTIPWQVPAGQACGSVLVVPVTYSTATGTVVRSFPLPIGIPVVGLAQNFDAVAAPALPAGWTTTVAAASGGINGTAWATTGANTVDAANNCFSPDLAGNNSAGGEASLVSPVIAISAAASQLSFKHRYSFEVSGSSYYDGGVLEIQIGGGSFTDIVAAGGVFRQGGYNCSLYSTSRNPLGGRNGWGGASGGTITTVVDLPAAAAGQNVQFRWRLGFDSTGGATGWNVDTISVVASRTCTSVDADGDGLQNGYEMANGLDQNDASDAARDADGDGYTNLQEYLAGTNPQNAASALRVQQLSFNAQAGATFSFPSVNGKRYEIQYKDELTAATWTVLQTNLAGTGSDLAVSDAGATTPGKRFYRIVVQ